MTAASEATDCRIEAGTSNTCASQPAVTDDDDNGWHSQATQQSTNASTVQSVQTAESEDCQDQGSSSHMTDVDPATVPILATVSNGASGQHCQADEQPTTNAVDVCDEHGITSSIKAVDHSQLAHVVLPRKIHCRGRPKGTNNSLNKKFGVTSVGRSKRAAREEEVADDICYICFQQEPPKGKMSGSEIDWVDCATNCLRWFHVVCLPAGAEPHRFSCRSCKRQKQ